MSQGKSRQRWGLAALAAFAFAFAFAQAGPAVAVDRCKDLKIGAPGDTGPAAEVPPFALPRDFGVTAAPAPAPGGLVAVAGNFPTGKVDNRVFTHPNINGVAYVLTWNQLEPQRGKIDWSTLDTVFADAALNHVWVQLVLVPGFDTPDWALQGVATACFPIPYGFGSGQKELLPMPWDEVYLHRWFIFLREVSVRYASNPALRMIAAAGPTSVSAEFTLPNWPPDLGPWIRLGFKPSRYIAAWSETLLVYRSLFPNQYLTLTLGGPLDIDEHGNIVSGEDIRTRKAMVAMAMGMLGPQLAIEMDNLDGAPKAGGTGYLISLNGQAVTGLQMRTGASDPSMGPPGDTPQQTLQLAIDNALQPNSDGKTLSYLEIYEGDFLNPAEQATLRSGALRFLPPQPPNPHVTTIPRTHF